MLAACRKPGSGIVLIAHVATHYSEEAGAAWVPAFRAMNPDKPVPHAPGVFEDFCGVPDHAIGPRSGQTSTRDSTAGVSGYGDGDASGRGSCGRVTLSHAGDVRDPSAAHALSTSAGATEAEAEPPPASSTAEAAGPAEVCVLKPTFDAFQLTDLETTMRRHGITQTFVVGLVTSACVHNTAQGAFFRGLNPVVVEDACGDRSVQRHETVLALYGGYVYKLITSEALETLLQEGSRGGDGGGDNTEVGGDGGGARDADASAHGGDAGAGPAAGGSDDGRGSG